MDTCYEKGRIIDANCTYADGKFILGCLPGCLPTLSTIRFKAPEDFTQGDLFVVKGKEMPPKTPAMAEAPSGMFKAGAIVLCELDLDGVAVFFCNGGSTDSGGGAPVLPNLSYDEQYAGFNSFDGKKVYVRTVYLGQLSGSDMRFPHNIPNIDEIIDFSVTYRKDDGLTCSGNYSSGNSTGFQHFYCTKIEVVMATRNENLVTVKARATIYYTCTDR